MKTGYHLNRELLSAYLDDMLPEGRKQKVKEHLDSCTECREIFQGLEAVRQLLRKYPLKDPGVGFQTAILSRIEEEKKSLALRAWSRRVSLSLGGLALILITFLFLYKPYLPPPAVELEKTPVQPQAEKIKEKGALAPTKPSTPEKEYAVAREEEQKQPSGPTTKSKIVMAPILPPAGSKVSVDASLGEVTPPAEEEKALTISSRKIGGDLVLQEKVASAPSAPEGLKVMKPAVIPALPPQNTIIRTSEEWTKTWNVQNTVQNVSLPLPQVDFKNQMVIAVSTCQDHRKYRIVKTEDKKDKIVVQYQEIAAGKDEEKSLPPYQLEVVNSRPSVEFQKVD